LSEVPSGVGEAALIFAAEGVDHLCAAAISVLKDRAAQLQGARQ
jgi:hypothetical protein